MATAAVVRDKILNGGLKLASVQGLHALSMGDLARELDLSRSGVSQHFATPESLQLAVIERAADLFIREVVEPGQSAPAGEARIRALFANWIKWSRAPRLVGGCPFVHASAKSASLPEPVKAKLAEVLDGWSAVLAGAIAEGKAAELIRADADAQQLVFELYGLYLSHHFWHWSMRDPQSQTRTFKAYERLAASMAA